MCHGSRWHVFAQAWGRVLRATSLAALSSFMVSLSACSGADHLPKNSDEKLIQATLAMLDGKGEPLCVDEKTVGHPLAVFKSIASNPSAAAAPPTWFAPARFSPPAKLSSADLYRDELGDGAVHLDQPANTGSEVGASDRATLDRAAFSLSKDKADRSVTISQSWQKGMKARWWLRNRVSNHCSPNYHLSNPVHANDLGFVTVTANHWGTTYAFKRNGADWVATAQWSNWLY